LLFWERLLQKKLELIRKFYTVYKNAKSVISQSLSWTHYIYSMGIENKDDTGEEKTETVENPKEMVKEVIKTNNDC